MGDGDGIAVALGHARGSVHEAAVANARIGRQFTVIADASLHDLARDEACDIIPKF